MKHILLMFFVVYLISACDSENQINNNQKIQSKSTKAMIQRLDLIISNLDTMSMSFMNNEKLLILQNITSINYNQKNIQSINNLAIEHLNAGNSKIASELFLNILRYMENNNKIYLKSSINKLRTKLIISYMRMGEQSNCIMLNTSSSCIFPLDPQAIHLNQEGSRHAIKHLEIMLQKEPDNISLKWLYTIAKQTVGEYPDTNVKEWLIPIEKFTSKFEVPKFNNVAPQTMTAINDLAGGSILDDFNNDGFIDIIASSWGFNGQIKTFLNDKSGGFIDTTETAGLKGLMGGLNMISADYDNDGDLDILVLRGAWLMENGRLPNSLLMNDGNGFFTDVTESSNILSYHPTQTAAWADFDNDGWLDLFIGNETLGDIEHKAEFYHNNQDGTFTDISKELNLSINGYVKGSAWGDYNNDGKQDLYISIMDKHNRLFRNDSTEYEIKFTDVTELAGVGEPIFSFPTWFWDFNNDGWLDIFVADYNLDSYISQDSDSNQLSEVINNIITNKPSSSSPKLFLNNANGTFTDVTNKMELNKPLFAMGVNFGDIDNDGFLDMYIGTGDPDFKTLIPNRMFRNNKGQFFQDVTTSAGVGHLQKGHAVSFADIDNDGDQDIYAVIGGAFSGDFYPNVFFENSGNSNNWITLKLEGSQSNKSAFGARVELIMENDEIEHSIHRVVGTGGSFGANSLQLEIGLGKFDNIKTINILWPSGISNQYSNVNVNQIIKIVESNNKIHKVIL